MDVISAAKPCLENRDDLAVIQDTAKQRKEILLITTDPEYPCTDGFTRSCVCQNIVGGNDVVP